MTKCLANSANGRQSAMSSNLLHAVRFSKKRSFANDRKEHFAASAGIDEEVLSVTGDV